jgi:hypothetical protein
LLASTTAVFLAPTVAARLGMSRLTDSAAARYGGRLGSQHHEVWHVIWCGLGDYDPTGRHAWSDEAARQVVEQAGGPRIGMTANAEYEQLMKRIVLREIRSDPAWFAGILGRRTLATLVQYKLWPHPLVSGRSLAVEWNTRNKIDDYYALTPHADSFGFLKYEVELSLLPFAALSFWFCAAVALPRPGAAAGSERAVAALLCALAVGSLALPVLVTTAGALETQAFFVVHFAGTAFWLERRWRAPRSRAGVAGAL